MSATPSVAPDLHAGSQYSQASTFTGGMHGMHSFEEGLLPSNLQ